MDVSVRNIFCIDKATFLLTDDDRLFYTGSIMDSPQNEKISSFKEIESMRGIRIKKIVKTSTYDSCLLFVLTFSGEIYMWGIDKFNLAGREISTPEGNVIKIPIINKDLLGKKIIDIYSDNYNVYFQTQDDKILTYDFFTYCTYYSSKKEYGNHSLQEIKTPKIGIKKMIYIDYLAFIVTDDGELYQCRKKGKFHTDSYTRSIGYYCGSESYDGPIICNEVEKIDLKGLRIVSIGESLSYVLLSDHNVYNITFDKYSGSLLLKGPHKSVSCFNNPQIITPLDHDTTIFFLTEEGKLYGKGNNEVGQLGIGTTSNNSDESYLIEKLADKILTSLMFVSRHSHGQFDSLYAVTTDGSLYAWGCNNRSCLGLGTTQKNYKVPTLVKFSNNDPIEKVVINEWSNFYIMRNGNIYVSGDNTEGQLGIGDFSVRTKPSLLRGFKFTSNNDDELVECSSLSLEKKIKEEGLEILRRYKELLALAKTNPKYTEQVRKIGVEIASLATKLPTGDNHALIQALLSLGYSKTTAILTSSRVDSRKDIKQQITEALTLIDHGQAVK